MNATYKSVDCVVEETTDSGLTGRFHEVSRVQVRDYGNNVLWEGTAAEYLAARPAFRIPTRLVAVAVTGEPSEHLVGDTSAVFADL